MLYSEFLKGTRAPETPDTYDQFQIIERIYTDCEGMTNLEVYDKASNGFKVRNLGSAKSVSFTWTIINTNIQ